MWEVARRVAERRRSRELDPLLRVVGRLEDAEAARADDAGEARAFRRLMKDIGRVGKDAGRLLGLATALDRVGFFGRALRAVRR